MRKILLDVDTGIDDAVAILLAARSQDLELLGVTTVAGNVPLDLATDNTLRVLDLAAATAVPVVAGAAAPLRRPYLGTDAHGRDGLGGQRLPAASRPPQPGKAADFILETVARWPGQVTLVPVGPLTNIAIALQKDPATMARVREVIVMGGAYFVPGNVTPVAEFNIWTDPDAARLVLGAGLRLTLVGLDVTYKALAGPREQRLFQEAGTAMGGFVAGAIAQFLPRHRKILGREGAALHDALAVAAAIRPGLLRTEPHTVDVETEGRLTIGQTVVDRRGLWGRPANARIARGVDAAAFRRLLLERLADPRAAGTARATSEA